MSDSKTIAKIYKKQKKSLLKHLNSAKKYDEDKIHKLRVDVKKLRSLYKFLEQITKGKFSRKKIMKVIKPVYKSAGNIRTTALNLELVEELNHNTVSDFKDNLKKQEKPEEKKFGKRLKKFDKKKFKKADRKVISAFKRTGENTVVKNSGIYVSDRLNQIYQDIPFTSNDDYFHDIRKKLKDIKTITGLLENFSDGSKPVLQDKDIQALEEKIGKWHDQVCLIQEMENFVFKNKTDKNDDKKAKDIQKLSDLALNFKKDCEINKKQITAELKKKLFPADQNLIAS